MRKKVVEWIKLIIIQHLSHERNFVKNFFNYENFKREIRIVFEVINEVVMFKRIVQYLIQKTFVIDYAQRFKICSNKIDWNNYFKMNIFKRDLKNNIKKINTKERDV